MSNILVPIIPGNLTPNYCFSSWQKTLVDFSAAQQGQLPNGAFFMNVGDTLPGPDFQAFPWLYTADGRIYRFDGQWITPHEYQQPNCAGLRQSWEASEADLATFDGGDANATHSDRSGPMWAIDHNYDGRSGMGPGLIPGSDPAKTLAVSEAFGNGSYTLLAENGAGVSDAHIHVFGRMGFNFDNDDFAFTEGATINASLPAVQIQGAGGSGGNPAIPLGTYGTGPYLNTGPAQLPGGGTPAALTPFNIVHPVRGCYKIKRTSRVFRVATGV